MYKILLADDEGIELDAMKFILDKNFNGMCNVATAKTGRGAIELAETFRPDIAVMDIRMPGINGIDAMREMRSIQPNIIFIIMTAYDKFEYESIIGRSKSREESYSHCEIGYENSQ